MTAADDETHLRAMLRGDAVSEHALLELRHAARSIESGLVEGIALWMLSEGHEVEDVARLLKVEIVTQALPQGVYGMRVPLPVAPEADLQGYVLVTPIKSTALRRLVIAHELVHGAVRSSKFSHTHADVWAITLAVLMPRDLLDAFGSDDVTAVAAEFAVPWWAAWARLRMLGLIGELDAA